MNSTFYQQKTVLLTGATGDLGRALARGLGELGATLILSARSEEKLAELLENLPKESGAMSIAADLSRPGAAADLAEQALARAGRVDILINNAGLGYFALMEEAVEDTVRYLFEVNTFAPLALLQKLVPSMARRGGGRVINIVSSAGRVPIPTVGVYGGSKSALAVMTNTMRLELAPKNIDIINIYPGTINDSFERNAMRESNRLGLCPTDDCGKTEEIIAREIIEAAAGEPGEVWLEKSGKWMALGAIAWPTVIDKRLRHLRNSAVSESTESKPLEYRRWRLLQVESSIACNLRCIMCPWEQIRGQAENKGHMSPAVWEGLVAHLNEVRSVDFTGGGEPLLQPQLIDWIGQAKQAGCDAGFLTNGMLLDERISDRLLDIGLNWIGFSIDGADRQTYGMIRRGANFEILCSNIKYLTDKRIHQMPMVMINFVIMRSNYHHLEKIIRLARELGVDQVNFKQCDVIRGEHGKGHGLFEVCDSKQVRQLQKALAKAARLGRKIGIRTTSYSFVPEELSVCDQDPRDSLFIRYDGTVAPCINLAFGGPSSFLGEDIVFPHFSYGRLPNDDLLDMWESEEARFHRRSFCQRVKAHDAALGAADLGHDIIKLKEAFKQAIEAMPPAPEGCRKCHYLYDI